MIVPSLSVIAITPFSSLSIFIQIAVLASGTPVFRSMLLMVSVVPVADTVSNDGDFKAPRAATRGSEYAYFYRAYFAPLST